MVHGPGHQRGYRRLRLISPPTESERFLAVPCQQRKSKRETGVCSFMILLYISARDLILLLTENPLFSPGFLTFEAILFAAYRVGHLA